jgi:hypothetical protein
VFGVRCLDKYLYFRMEPPFRYHSSLIQCQIRAGGAVRSRDLDWDEERSSRFLGNTVNSFFWRILRTSISFIYSISNSNIKIQYIMMSSPGLNPGLPQIRILPAVFRLGNPRECNVASSVNMTPTATQPRHDILTVLHSSFQDTFWLLQHISLDYIYPPSTSPESLICNVSFLKCVRC